MINEHEYQRVLGEELRTLRKERGLTRKQLCARLSSELSLQTIATYENGTRNCSVPRFATLCLALDIRPQDVIARVQRRFRLATDDEPGTLWIDLAAVARIIDPRLAPLRRWAVDRVSEAPCGEVALPAAAVELLAELCGVSTRTLVQQLDQLRRAA